MNDELPPRPHGPSTGALAAGPDSPIKTADIPPEGPPTAGGLLRAARQAQGIDLASLAAMLKLPLRKLEALENGRHDELQGPTFERALAQAACRVLKVDPKPVLALMPHYAGNTLEHVTGGLNTPFRERQGRLDLGEASTLMRPVMVLVLLIVLAALALFYVPAGLVDRLLHPVLARLSADAPAATDAPAPAGTTTSSIVLPSVGSGGAPADAAASAPTPASAAATTTNPAPVPTPDAAAAPAGVDEVLAHSEAPPAIALQVVATADSWVEVVDAKGHSLLSRTVVAGESVGLDGLMPMRIKIGNARGTRLTLRGDNVDLTPWTRDNVARVELK